jgi:hypothetical protein
MLRAPVPVLRAAARRCTQTIWATHFARSAKPCSTNVGLVLANQYLAQLEEQIRDALLGNVGTLVAFRVGYSDAEILA